MTSKYNQRWIITGVIWLAALFISYGNYAKINTMTTVRENSERLRKEFAFQHRNSEKLVHVQDLYQAFFKPVASVKLGFESVRTPLHALAALFGLKNVTTENHVARATHEMIPFTIRMMGDHQKALGFATALLKYPYIAIDSSRITIVNQQEGTTEIEMDLQFQFRIAPPEQMDSTSLQASNLQSIQGVQRQ